jgi:hypothetical protein
MFSEKVVSTKGDPPACCVSGGGILYFAGGLSSIIGL